MDTVNYRKSILYGMLFFVFFVNANSQIKNKVVNPSFEMLDSCDCINGSYASGWKLFGFNSNYVSLNSCCPNTSSFSVPSNYLGFQQAKEGFGYSITGPIGNPYDSVFRGYLQSKLVHKLKSKMYHIYIYISR
jgi:hypothetical protein